MGLDPLRERATARAVIKVHRAIYEWAKGQEAVAPYAAGQIVFADGTKVELVDGLVKIVADGETFTVERFGSYIAEFERTVEGCPQEPLLQAPWPPVGREDAEA